MAVPFTSGLNVGTGPPLGRVTSALRAARTFGFDTAWTVDHFLGFFPEQIWDKDFTWLAKPGESPHEYFEYQTLLGYLAARAGKVRLGVGVTEPTRRHPVLLAQAFLSLAHMTERAPVLGIGSGERENIEPYGLDFAQPVGRLEEALAIIRLCFAASGPFDFAGNHYQLEGARMDLAAPPERTPEIWVAAHGPRMLDLAGRYGDGWYPGFPFSPQRYGEMLGTIREAAHGSGRDPDGIVAAWQAVVVVARSRKEARHMLEALAQAGHTPRRLVAVGGGTQHPLWPRIVSDVTGVAQELPAETVGASYGDAWLGGVAAGLIDRASDWSRITEVVEPDASRRARYDDRYAAFRALYPATADVVHGLAADARAG